jgi:hypothetical protein
VRRQKDLVGFRKVVAMQYNLAVEPKDRLSEEALVPLQAVDGPATKPTPAKAVSSAWLARMKEKHGDNLELG